MGIIKNKIPQNVIVFIEDKSYELFEIIIQTSVAFLEYLSQERPDFIRNFPRFKHEMIQEQNTFTEMGIKSQIIDEDESTMFLDEMPDETIVQPVEQTNEYQAQIDNGLMRNYQLDPNKTSKATSYIAFLQHIDLQKIKWVVEVMLDLKEVFTYEPISITNITQEHIKNEIEDMLSIEFKKRYIYYISVVTKKQKDAKYASILKQEENKIPLDFPNRLQKISEIKHTLMKRKRDELQAIQKDFISDESCRYLINFFDHFSGYLLENTSSKLLYPNIHFFSQEILQNECSIVQEYLNGNSNKYTKELILNSKITGYFPNKEQLFRKVVNKAIDLVRWTFETKLRISDTENEFIQRYLAGHKVWIQDPRKRNIKLDMLVLFNALQKEHLTVEYVLKKYFSIVLLLSNRYSFSQFAKNLFLKSNRTFGDFIENKSIFYLIPELVILTSEQQKSLLQNLEINSISIINDIFDDTTSTMSEYIVSNENVKILKNICSNSEVSDPAFYYKLNDSIICVSQDEIDNILKGNNSEIPSDIKEALIKLFNKHSPHDFDIKLNDIDVSINKQLDKELVLMIIPEIESLKKHHKYINFDNLHNKSLLKKIILNTPATKDEYNIALQHLLSVATDKIGAIKKEIIHQYLKSYPAILETIKNYTEIYSKDQLFLKIILILSGDTSRDSLWDSLSKYTFTIQSIETKNEIISYILEYYGIVQKTIEQFQQCDLCKIRTTDLSYIIKNDKILNVCVNCIPDELEIDEIQVPETIPKTEPQNILNTVKELYKILGTSNLNTVILNYPITVINKCEKIIDMLPFNVSGVTWNNIVGVRAKIINLQLNSEFMNIWNTVTAVKKYSKKEDSIIDKLKSDLTRIISDDTHDIGTVMKKWFIENKKGDIDYSLIEYQKYLNTIKLIIRLTINCYNKTSLDNQNWTDMYRNQYNTYYDEYSKQIEKFISRIKQEYLTSELIETRILNFSQSLGISQNYIKSLIENKIEIKDVIQIILLNNYIYNPEEALDWFIKQLYEIRDVILNVQQNVLIKSELVDYVNSTKKLEIKSIKNILKKSPAFNNSMFYYGMFTLKNKLNINGLNKTILLVQQNINTVLSEIISDYNNKLRKAEDIFNASLHPIYIYILKQKYESKTVEQFIEKLINVKIELNEDMINSITNNFTVENIIETLFESHHSLYKKYINIDNFENNIKDAIIFSNELYPKSTKFNTLSMLLSQYIMITNDTIVAEYLRNIEKCSSGLQLSDIHIVKNLFNTVFTLLDKTNNITADDILEYTKIIPPKIQQIQDFNKIFEDVHLHIMLKNYTQENSILRICENISIGNMLVDKSSNLDLDDTLMYGLNYLYFFNIYSMYTKNMEIAISVFLREYIKIYTETLSQKQFTPPDEFLRRGISEYAGPSESASIMKKNWDVYQKQQIQSILSVLLKTLKIKYNYTHIYSNEKERKIFEQLLKKVDIQEEDNMYDDQTEIIDIQEEDSSLGDGDGNEYLDYGDEIAF